MAKNCNTKMLTFFKEFEDTKCEWYRMNQWFGVFIPTQMN